MGSFRRLLERRALLALCLALSFVHMPSSIEAQIIRPLPPRVSNDDNRAGPRIGVAYLIGGSVTAEREGRSVSPLMTLIGWQLERQFDTGRRDFPVPMTELLFLVGGLEQSVPLPSVSWLVGFRQPNGWEGAIGPSFTGAGTQFVFAAGVTSHIGTLDVPVNVAIAPGRRGASLSVTTGFTVGN